MTILTLTAAERHAQSLAPETLRAALQAIAAEGFVVLDPVCPAAPLAAIYQQMLRDIARWPDKHGGQPFTGGNLLPARSAALLFPEVLHNPFVAGVLTALLGAEPSCGFYSSNVTMPGLGEQQLHVDMAPLKDGEAFGGPCATVVVNFPLVDFTLVNGATEVWPGTHLLPRRVGEFWVDDAWSAGRRAEAPPERAVIPCGSVLIRDIRLWHRGVRNHTDIVRPMIAMICNGGYRPGIDPPATIPCCGTFPEDARPAFEQSPRLYYRPRYAPGPVDYLTADQHEGADG